MPKIYWQQDQNFLKYFLSFQLKYFLAFVNFSTANFPPSAQGATQIFTTYSKNLQELPQREKIQREVNFAAEIELPTQIKLNQSYIKVFYISDGCCTEFNIYYFILYLFQVVNDSIFILMMLVESGILLKNHVSCNLC